MLKKLCLFLFFINFSFAGDLNLNKNLSEELFQVRDLVYQNPDLIRRSSLAFDVSENKDFLLSFVVDRIEYQKSNYTLVFLRYNNSMAHNNKLFCLKINKDNSISFIEDKQLLSLVEFLEKQDFILKLVKDYRLQLELKNNINKNLNKQVKDIFMNQN